MLIADVNLARRVEAAEVDLSRGAALATAAATPGRDVLIEPVGGGVAVYAGPGFPINKAIGLGLDGPVSDETLDRLEELHRARAAMLQVEVCPLADLTLAPALGRRGFRLEGFENVLGRVLGSDAGVAAYRDVDSGVEVRIVPPGEERAWTGTVARGFAAPETASREEQANLLAGADGLEATFQEFFALPGTIRFIASVDGELAGGAGMRFVNRLAQLFGASTMPSHRRRGVQSALLYARLRHAVASGADFATTTTRPGSTSQRNVQRHGFGVLYTRAVLVKDYSA